MGGGGHGPTKTYFGQPKGWSGWVQDRVPYCGQLYATVQVHGLLTQLDVDSLDCSSLPVACHTAPLHPGTIPVNRVVQLMGMDCNAILWVSTLHRLLVLSKSHLERPLGLPDVGLMAFFTWNLVDYYS